MQGILYWCCVFTIVAGAAVVGVEFLTAVVELVTAIVELFKAI